jgi:hypothetical protein
MIACAGDRPFGLTELDPEREEGKCNSRQKGGTLRYCHPDIHGAPFLGVSIEEIHDMFLQTTFKSDLKV